MTQPTSALDQEIIRALRPNPRATNKEIAAELNVAEATVAQRIRSMAERGAMRVTPQKHVYSDGYSVMCFLFLRTSGRTVQAIARDIIEHDFVISASQGIGDPDMFVNIRGRSLQHVHSLAARLGEIKGITAIETCICYRVRMMAGDLGDLSVRPLDAFAPRIGDAGSVDDAIFAQLFPDGRISNREIARKLDVSEGTVRQRINKMLLSGQMQFQVVCDPRALGIGTNAIARVTTNPKRTETVIASLKALGCIAFLGEVSGEANVLALLSMENNLALADAVDNKLLTMAGVQSVRVQLLVKTFKHQYHLSFFEPATKVPKRK